MTIRELRQRRAGFVSQARALVDKADAEKRALTQEEQNQYDELMKQTNELGADIARRETLEQTERELRESAHEPTRPDPGGTATPPVATGRSSEAYRKAFNTVLRGGLMELGGEELRALQADNDTLGGYLQAPMQFVNELIKAVDNLVFIRGLSTVMQVPNAESLGVPTLETDVSDANWTTELATGSEDSSMAFGRRALTPWPMAKRIKISRDLLRKVPDSEQLVRDRLAYKFAITEEKGFLTGSGAKQALGVFTASNDGIPTTRDYSTGNLTTAMTFDGLIGAKYTLKGNYWPRATWIFHRDGLGLIAKLKDGEGQYIWRESVRVGEPDRLLNLPFAMSEYAPNTFTTGLYGGILGDFKAGYWIADALNMEVQRINELYAETNQVGLIGRQAVDGMPVLAEAFVRVKLA